MVLVGLILVLMSVGSLQSWDELEDNQFDLLTRWGISRVKRGKVLIKEKFPDTPMRVCDMMHETAQTPFAAVVLYKSSGRLLCLGSIVDHKHVLSAKRCYERTDNSDILVLLGYYKAYWGRHSQVIKVKKIVRHEYEIAILRLERPIQFTDFIQAVRLPPSVTKKEQDLSKVFPNPYELIGFQVDRFDVPGDYIDKSDVYIMKEDSYVAFDTCKKNYTKYLLDKEKVFCTFGNATFCWGGMGGPVLKFMPEHDYYLQIGVVVADNCTADTTGPYLVARTDVFGDWIRGNSFHGHHPS